MINFQVFSLCRMLDGLRRTETDFEMRVAFMDAEIQHGGGYQAVLASNIAHEVTDIDKRNIDALLELAERIGQYLELKSIRDRVDLFRVRLRNPVSIRDFLAEVRALRETIDKGLDFQYFYRYPTQTAEVVLKFWQNWEGVIRAFPAVKAEAECAVDLYALNHNTASVFHSMRVAEYGLRAIAKERRITLPKNKLVEWASWQEIISALNREAETIGKTKRASAAKDRALEFYSGAVADLNGFKDEYRNLVMHVRVEYDNLQALRALQRVHAFMERISEKIDHKNRRIRWGFR